MPKWTHVVIGRHLMGEHHYFFVGFFLWCNPELVERMQVVPLIGSLEAFELVGIIQTRDEQVWIIPRCIDPRRSRADDRCALAFHLLHQYRKSCTRDRTLEIDAIGVWSLTHR